MGRALLLVPLALLLGTTTRERAEGLPPSALFVWRDSAWVEWWNSERAPARYDESNSYLRALLAWRPVANGVELGDLQLSGNGEAWRLRVIVARIDPRRARLTFVPQGRLGPWNIDSMSSDAVLAMNGGQFHNVRRPWGWLVLDRRERQAPEIRALAMALTIDSTGGVALTTRDEMMAARTTGSLPFAALQSYPVALVDGVIPTALRDSGRGVNVAHRDGRLAICTTRDGFVLTAITRFDALDGRVPELPFGTTAPEMAAIMGSLGCWRALMLDGGISRQFGVREHGVLTLRHKGWRDVPMGIEVVPRVN